MFHKNIIITSAPGKLMLLGDHAVVHNHPCLVTTVDYRVFAEVSVSEKDTFEFPKGNGDHFVRTALSLFREQFNCSHRFKIKTWSEYDQSYGLGSSSAVTVSVVRALAELCEIEISQKELFDICYKTVLEVQEVGSGFDIAAAIWGGTLLFFTGGKAVEPLPIEKLPLVVAYSGSKGDTATLIKMVASKLHEKPDEFKPLLNESEEIVKEGKKYLTQNDYESFGAMMNKNHTILQKLGVSTGRLDDMVSAALHAGAYGAKLSGAGGGDCMIALSPSDKQDDIEKALEQSGGTILKVNAHAEGVKIHEIK